MGTEYPKINSIFKRDRMGRIIVGDYAEPEFHFLDDFTWQFTEKVDGTNVRLHVPSNVDVPAFQLVGGRTDNAQLPPKLLAACTSIVERVIDAKAFNGDAVLYGEGYGDGIQSGGMYRPDPSFVLFDVRVGEWWLTRPSVEDVAAKLGLDIVPIVGLLTLADAVKKMLGDEQPWFESAWNGARPEGVVGQPVLGLCNRRGERIITKLKFKDFAKEPK